MNNDNEVVRSDVLVKIKVLAPGCTPRRNYATDACFDVMACAPFFIKPMTTVKIPLGFALEIPEGWEAQIRPRSGLNAKGAWCPLGTVDAGYRGEVQAIIMNFSTEAFEVNVGDRIAQMAIRQVPYVEFEIVEELSSSDRGNKGFGSSGVGALVSEPGHDDLNRGTDS